MVVTLALVIGTAAGLLRALDSVPDFVRGEPRGAKRLRSVEEVEQRLSQRLLLPAYFPDTLRWPPATIRIHDGPPPSVALTFLDQSGETVFVVYQSFGTPAAPPRELLPPMQALQSSRVALHDKDAELVRLLGADGRIWHDVAWRDEGRAVTLRFRGAVGELLTMARSTRERR
jgi:hypothetical protein